MEQARSVTFYDIDRVGKILLPRLATLCWARRQALQQERLAAGQDKKRWRMVIRAIDKETRATQHKVTVHLDVLKFEVQEELF